MCTNFFLQISFSILMALGYSQGLFAFENRAYEDVLASNYKNCQLKKENVFLSAEEKKAIEKDLDFKISPLLLRFENPCRKSFIYIDSHIVRTQNETVVLEIAKDAVLSLEIASFMEPKEYLPPQKWIDLALNSKGVDALSGATLSQNSILNVLKKYKIVNRVLNDKK